MNKFKQLKEVAEKNNRSMESQVRSILEEWLAGTVAHEMTRKTNFYDEIREFMEKIDFDGSKKERFQRLNEILMIPDHQ